MRPHNLRGAKSVLRYWLGAATVLPPLLLCELFRPWLGRQYTLPLVAGVAIAAWSLGTGPALLSLTLSILAANYLFMPPFYQFGVEDSKTAVSIVALALTGALIVGLIHNLSRIHSDLEQSRRRSRSLGELIPFGIWTADEQGRITYVSDSFLRTFGSTLEECAGFGWTQFIAAEERNEVIQRWRNAASASATWDHEYHMVARDGSRHTVLSRGICIDSDNRGWVGIHLDVTERERAAEARMHQERELARFNAELEQFAYVSAHDLQEPLRMVASYVQLLAKKYQGKLDENAEVYIHYASEGAMRLQSLLQDLLVLSQVGKYPEKRKPIDLTSVAQTATGRLSSKIEMCSAQVTVDPLPEVQVNELEMLNLLVNLIDNALKYRRPEVHPEVHISSALDGAYHMVCIEDNGLGIAEEYQERIFRVFQRLHGRDEYPGTGIGLAICKKIVESHGGRIWVDSNVNRGSRFYFTLPVNHPELNIEQRRYSAV